MVEVEDDFGGGLEVLQLGADTITGEQPAIGTLEKGPAPPANTP